MPSLKRWTLIFVPPQNGRAKSVELPSWAFRALGWTAGISTLLVIGAVVVLFTEWGTPGARLVAAQNRELQRTITEIEERFRILDDTLRTIAEREEQLRMLAGLPVEVSPIQEPSAGDEEVRTEVAGLNADFAEVSGIPSRRRPFLGRLGWSARPDIDGLIARASSLASGFQTVSDTLQSNFQRFANTPSILPTAGWLSSHFSKSRFHPILHENRPHEGIDVSAPTGTPIVAPAAGRVVVAGNSSGYGLTVEIDHGNGIRTRFAHCSRVAVRVGQQVTRNQLIAAVGSTGLSTAPHLHYEIHVDGRPVDPLTYVLPETQQP